MLYITVKTVQYIMVQYSTVQYSTYQYHTIQDKSGKIRVIRAVKSVLIKGVLEYLQRYMLNNPLVLTYIILGL